MKTLTVKNEGATTSLKIEDNAIWRSGNNIHYAQMYKGYVDPRFPWVCELLGGLAYCGGGVWSVAACMQDTDEAYLLISRDDGVTWITYRE